MHPLKGVKIERYNFKGQKGHQLVMGYNNGCMTYMYYFLTF